jgi:hypothetical protein
MKVVLSIAGFIAVALGLTYLCSGPGSLDSFPS